MRFSPEGPQLPDELLVERDKGRVVFFCGSGVSRAHAKLDDFFTLAKHITNDLHALSESPAVKILNEAAKVTKRTRVDGLISADKIFGLLERDFLSRDIYEAVANRLSPQHPTSLNAHKIMLRLAKTSDNQVRLITTNFDRLFELSQPEIKSFLPSSLPDLTKPDEFNGVVYLHGKINSSGSGAENDRLVLSSSEFGDAYLANGWATNFVKEIFNKFTVVFIGYSADDPPIHYLLEALNRNGLAAHSIYTFQKGSQEEADTLWKHKGVKAISFEDYPALWETLNAWAARADDPSEWTRQLIEAAKPGPEDMEPYQRGQVAHIVSTIEGMKAFASGDSVPPSTWLNVFDPKKRLNIPSLSYHGDENEETQFSPFDAYALDSDEDFKSEHRAGWLNSSNSTSKVWNAFTIGESDSLRLDKKKNASIAYDIEAQLAKLPERLSHLGRWLSRVSHQYETIHWAATQSYLHPDIQHDIKWHLIRLKELPASVYEAWFYLLDSWKHAEPHNTQTKQWLIENVKKSGWNRLNLRTFSKAFAPHIRIDPPYSLRKKYNDAGNPKLKDLIRRKVTYPELPRNMPFPDKDLAYLVPVIRLNLEAAIRLESETANQAWGLNFTLRPNRNTRLVTMNNFNGLASWTQFYAQKFSDLAKFNKKMAKHEMSQWLLAQTKIFAKLTMWSIGLTGLVSKHSVAPLLRSIPNEYFWDRNNVRDLILPLASRWNGLPSRAKIEIEQRILAGPDHLSDESEVDYQAYEARLAFGYLMLLHREGCQLNTNIAEFQQRLGRTGKDIDDSSLDKLLESPEPRSGIVTTDKAIDSIMEVPLDQLIVASRENTGRTGNFLVEANPFLGFCEKYPLRAISAIRLSDGSSDDLAWAWETYLESDSRKNDKARLKLLIAERLACVEEGQFNRIIRPICSWIKVATKTLSKDHRRSYLNLINMTRDKLRDIRDIDTALLPDSQDTEWLHEAINSPAGDLVAAMFYEEGIDFEYTDTRKLQDWFNRLEKLLALPAPHRYYIIAILASKIDWFYQVDSDWIRNHLLSVLKSEDKYASNAFWSGVMKSGPITDAELFLSLKPLLLKLAHNHGVFKNDQSRELAGYIYSAWQEKTNSYASKLISDRDFRNLLIKTDDRLRCSILWHARMGGKKDIEAWWDDFECFISTVWPRQIHVKSSEVSSCLCEIALFSKEHFSEMIDLILPFTATLDSGHNLNIFDNEAVDTNLEPTLNLLHKVLPPNVKLWPYGLGDFLQKISQGDESLTSNFRFIEIKKRWETGYI